MTLREFFEANLGTIERVIAIVSRRAQLFGPDAEDFASEVRLALIENDHEILRQFEGRSSLDTFLTVVISRLLADARIRAKGRWHPSSEAQRIGPVAVQLETLVRRDGRSVDEALPHIRAAHPGVTRDELATMLKRLPERRGRPRPVDIEIVAHAIAGSDATDARVLAGDAQRTSNAAAETVRAFLQELPKEDRVLLRLRFGSDMSIADVARVTGLAQRPLYRKLESLLVRLRTALVAAGIDRAAAEQLVGRDDEATVDFGLMNGKSDDASQSMQQEET